MPKITLDQFGEQMIRAGERAHEVALDAAERTLLEFQARAVARATYDAFDTGEYARGITTLRGDTWVALVNEAPHAVFIEGGRTPGGKPPPVKAPHCREPQCRGCRCPQCKEPQCKEPQCRGPQCKEPQCKEPQCKEPQYRALSCRGVNSPVSIAAEASTI